MDVRFSIPDGAVIVGASTDTPGVRVVYSTQSITADSITSDVLVVIVLQGAPSATHTVTVVARYLDGSRPDASQPYTVVDGKAFHHTYALPDGYWLEDVTASGAGWQWDLEQRSISINEDWTVIHINLDDSKTLGVIFTPANASDKRLTWTSSEPDSLSVDENGRLTALRRDVFISITATATNGVSGSILVTVD